MIIKEEKKNAETLNKTEFPIIAIGSSAGGLSTLETFFDNCTSESGCAFIVIQHLSPDYKSLMPELLSKHTKMNVKEATHNEKILPNYLYLIPGNKNIIIKNGCLELKNRSPLHQVNYSIDLFFKSLALEKKDRAICCILSGTGSDGTKGAKSIKEAGGVVFVQSPYEAKFNGMPNSVIQQDIADFILPVQDMADELLRFVKNDQLSIGRITNNPNDAEVLNRILNTVHYSTGFNFLHYKKPTLFRRTIKRMNICKKESFTEYLTYLENKTEEKFFLAKEYLIGVTKFFRDLQAFEVLEREVFPAIVKQHSKKIIPIRIWVVACSTGEEAYSLAMLLEDLLGNRKLKLEYKVFATDINEEAISVASKGIYPSSIASEVPEQYLKKYFIEISSGYQISPIIRNKIIFSKHDVLQNPPFGKLDLVSCRNMLIYLEQEMQMKALSRIHFGLNKNGFLFLGSSESASYLEKDLREIDAKWKIYKNLIPNRIIPQNFDNILRSKGIGSYAIKTESLKERATRFIQKSINSILVDELDLVFVCVDEHMEIVQASGKLKDFIEMPEQGFSSNLIKVLPDTFAIPIHSLMRKLRIGNNEKEERVVKWYKGNKLKEVHIVVKEVKQNDLTLHKKIYLILFKIIGDVVASVSDNMLTIDTTDQNLRVEELKETLAETRENLQSTIEELETTNEEMQATNEELIASNEELQSTNEELQSLNEELHTVNAELQEKNTELLISNSDIENLIKNVNVGTIFLDKELKIRRFTPKIKEHFSLREDDIGRPINHFSGTLDGSNLLRLAHEVMNSHEPYTKEVKNDKEIWFLMQIFPYKDQTNKIKGIVINFINIHDTKTAIKETARINEFLSHLIDTNPGIIYIYDLIRKENIYSSDNIAKIAGYTDQEIKELGSDLVTELFYPGDIKRIENHHKKMKALKDGEMLYLEYRIVNKITRKPIWIFSTDKVNERNKRGDVISILGVAQNIDHMKVLQNKLEISESRLKLAIKGNQAAIWELSDLELDLAWWSKEFFELLGYSSRQLKPKFASFLSLVHKQDLANFKDEIHNLVKELGDFEAEIRVKTKKWKYKWFRVNAKAHRSSDQNVKIVGTLININQKKEAENKLKNLNHELERFAYLASHDLKEPLRTITSFTNLFKEEYHKVLDDNAYQYLEFIENASSRMIRLTNDLLFYSQLDDKSLYFEPTDLNEVVADILMDLQELISQNNATIKIAKLPELYCDRVQIRQLFQNLISNSLKYAKKDMMPKIEIAYSMKGKIGEFYVKDNGIGIEKKHHQKIFEVFKRLHSNDEYEGTGIGLANCKRIIDNHQGKIWVRSSKDKGATFYFAIPDLKMIRRHEKDEFYSIG